MIDRRRALHWLTAASGLAFGQAAGLWPRPLAAWSSSGCAPETLWKQATRDEPLADQGARTAQEIERLASLADQPVHRLRFLGSHNSYHIAPDQVAASLIGLVAPEGIKQLDYTHTPLTQQLERWGLRQFEWDLYRDREGGRYAQPAAYRTALEQGTAVPEFDPEREMLKPGTKILHAPDFDYRSQNLSLASGCKELLAWSDQHPRHEPIFLLLELKTESYLPSTKPEPWDEHGLRALETELLELIGRERLFTPSDLLRGSDRLRDSVRRNGWPTLAQLAGKIVLLLDNEGAQRDLYLELAGGALERLIFASLAPGHEQAAWVKLNDPLGDQRRIREAAEQGMMIRTRSDSGLAPRFRNDFRQRDAALRSGAQLISTDFFCPDPLAPNYQVAQPFAVQVWSADQ